MTPPTNASTVITSPHCRLTATQLAALDEAVRKCGEMWHPATNPEGWATAPTEVAIRTKPMMAALVRAGLLRRRLPEFSTTYQYAPTEAGRKLAGGPS